MSTFPTWYTDKTTLTAWDKVFWYDSETGTPSIDWNKNFTLLSIYNYIISTISTTDVTEWDNLYYTEARVTANSTVVGLWTNVNTRALKTNVLELDNTTSYTPTADYHPVTKKFLEDQPYPNATTSQKWVVELATDAEALAWTDETRYINSKQAKTDFLSSEILSADTNYTATRDWIVLAYIYTQSSSSWFYIKIDWSVKAGSYFWGQLMYPVRVWEVYRIETTGWIFIPIS